MTCLGVADLAQSVLSNGRTALHEAAEGGDAETVGYLLSSGANPNAQDEVPPLFPNYLVQKLAFGLGQYSLMTQR